MKDIKCENETITISSDSADVKDSERHEKRKGIVSLIKMGVVAVSIILVVVYSTLSWFAGSKESEINNATLKVASDRGVRVSYEAYRFDPDTASCVRINIFNLINPNGLLLNEYDTIFTDRNENTGILMKIVITGEVELGNEAYLCLEREVAAHNSSTVYISDISYFQCATDSDCNLEAYNDDLDVMWTAAKAYFKGASSPAKRTFGTDNSIDMMDFVQTDFGRTVVWVYMNYDETLVHRAISNTSFTLNQTIEVTRDCDLIRVAQVPRTP